MLKIPEVKEYFDTDIFGNSPKKVEENKNCREHFKELIKELIKDYGFTEKDLKALNFTAEQIKYFLDK